jgi:hypothetical protein
MSETARYSSLRKIGLLTSVLGIAALGLGLFFAREEFFKSYLLGYSLFLALSLGALSITMLHHLTGGAWGFVLRRIHEASIGNIPLMGLLTLPIIAGMADIYPWARPEAASDEILRHKSFYLNPTFFIVRLAIYFTIWTAMAFFLRRWSLEQDRAKEGGKDPEKAKNRLRTLSGPGLVVYGLTVTFASIDLLMSLDPKWFSSVYALLMMVIQGLMALAFGTAIGALLPGVDALRQKDAKSNFHDLGNLLLAFIMLWAYMMLCQYLIIWSGNLPDETPWYIVRSSEGWGPVTVFLIIVHFGLPFFLLLFRANKRNLHTIGLLASGLLVAVLVDFFWLISPSFYSDGFAIHWLDLGSILAIGGLWLSSFAALLGRRPLIPIGDPDLPHGLVAANRGAA